ncbi:hypothetical protein JCM6882_004821 [Rhodosporidiobolus microsporus]
MAPVLPVYSSLPSSLSTAGLPQLDDTSDPDTLPLPLHSHEKQRRTEDDGEDTEEQEYELTDREGREGLLSGRRKREGDEDEGEYDGERETLEDALRVEARRKGWMKDVQITPRCSLLTVLFLSSCLLLLFLFHPSSPYSHSRSSGLYSSSSLSAPNPLDADSKYASVPFAKLGGSWSSSGKTPTWAGGDDGEKELEEGLGPGRGRRWNGTHWWDPTVILVSLDGVRADYLERGLTPHLLNISRKGMRAEYLQPVFPSLTFPNHWSILTGLYPSSHGIVANDFWDPQLQKEFVYTDPGRSWEGEWWGGEPIWSTAVKAGLRSAVLMWPGPPLMADGTKPSLWYPFVDHYHFRKKVDRVGKWLDMPYSHRPHLMAVYAPDVDQAGHKAGPHSKTVEKALSGLDEFVRQIVEKVDERNLTDVVDVVVVSDHGMTETSNDRLIYLDDLLGPDNFAKIDRNEGWPNAALRPLPGVDPSPLLAVLRAAAAKEGSGFECYDSREGVSEGEGGVLGRWHFGGSERISPIYCVPHLGWAFTTHHEMEKVMAGNYAIKGNHGYDNALPEMHGIFVAHGPFAERLKSSPLARRRLSRSSSPPSSASPLSSDTPLTRRDPIPTDPATTVLPGFANLEVYNLVADLLRIPRERRAQTNGTEGFWEGWLGPEEVDEDGEGGA